MKLLFLTLALPDIASGKGGFYADLINEMSFKGHDVYVICQNIGEKPTGFYKEGRVSVVRVNVPFLKTNTSLLRKGIGSLLMNPCFKKAFKKYFRDVNFDYVFVPTPPATLVNVAKVIETSNLNVLIEWCLKKFLIEPMFTMNAKSLLESAFWQENFFIGSRNNYINWQT